MRKELRHGLTGGVLFVLLLTIIFSYGAPNDRKQTAVASTSSVPKKAYELSHNFTNNALQVKNPNGKTTNYPLNQYSDFPSYDYSPSGEKVVFTQYEWEEDGAVRIFSAAKGVETIVDSKKSKSSVTPRGAVWLDDRYILLVQGSKYGTIISGKLYVYDTKLNSTKSLPLFKGDAITNITTSKTGDTPIIALIGIKFTDNNYNRNKPHVVYYPVAEVLKKIKAL